MNSSKSKMKSKTSALRLVRVLPAALLIFLSSCGSVSGDYFAAEPSYGHPPIAGPSVAAELETLDPQKFPAFVEWLGRWDKYMEQFESVPET